MQKRHFPWILLAILVAAFAGAGIVGLILAALVLFVIYLASLRLHPRIRHSRCNGTGEHRGAVFTWAHHKCSGCQGGRLIRAGAGIWGAEHIRREHARTRAARIAAKKDGSWR